MTDSPMYDKYIEKLHHNLLILFVKERHLFLNFLISFRRQLCWGGEGRREGGRGGSQKERNKAKKERKKKREKSND